MRKKSIKSDILSQKCPRSDTAPRHHNKPHKRQKPGYKSPSTLSHTKARFKQFRTQMDVKTVSVLPKALYPTTNSITRSELNPELNQSQGNVEVPEAKTVCVLPKALYPTTKFITRSELNPELNQSQGNVEVSEAKTVSFLPKALYPTTNSITRSELNPESVRQLFAEFQKSFSEITQKSLSEWKSQV